MADNWREILPRTLGEKIADNIAELNRSMLGYSALTNAATENTTLTFEKLQAAIDRLPPRDPDAPFDPGDHMELRYNPEDAELLQYAIAELSACQLIRFSTTPDRMLPAGTAMLRNMTRFDRCLAGHPLGDCGPYVTFIQTRPKETKGTLDGRDD